MEVKITAIAPWFGSKRTLAPRIVEALGPHRAYWEPFCFPTGTEVLTDMGWRAIETIRDGTLVLSCSGFNEVVRTYQRPYEGDVVTLRVKGDCRRLTCTPNHPVLCVRAERVHSVKQGWHAHFNTLNPERQWATKIGRRFRKLTIQRARALLNEAEWVDAGDVREGDFLVQMFDERSANAGLWKLPAARHGGRKRQRKTTIGINSETCRLVGLYLAEGCCDASHVYFSFHRDETDLIDFVRGVMLLAFGTEGSIQERPGSQGIALRFSSRQAIRFFGQFGRGARNKSIPQRWKLLPIGRQQQIIRGLFEGDGYVSKDGPLLVTVSPALAQDVFDLLLRQGFLPSLTEQVAKTTPPGRDAQVCHSYRLGVYGEGRRRIAKLLGSEMAEPKQRKIGANLRGCGTSPYGANATLRRVAVVERATFRGDVFNLQVSGHPSYSTRLCMAHNCGSMAVLMAKEPCSQETVNDLHGDVVNLARTLRDEQGAAWIYRAMLRTLPSEELFKESCAWLQEQGPIPGDEVFSEFDHQRAYHFLMSAWMGRNGVIGTKENNNSFCVRYTSNGGIQGTRFAAVADSIPDWHQRLREVTVLRRDGISLLERIEDSAGTAIYCDPPYLSKGATYIHDFADADHARLAEVLRRFKRSRVVVSYYDHPRLDELYPGWHKIDCAITKSLVNQGRRDKGGATKAPEVLLVNMGNSERSLF